MKLLRLGPRSYTCTAVISRDCCDCRDCPLGRGRCLDAQAYLTPYKADTCVGVLRYSVQRVLVKERNR
jgi:hypothetical protein